MRILCLIFCLLSAACVNRLARGDQAFAEKQWAQAAEEWNAVDGHNEKVALRLAILHAMSESALHNPERSEALAEIIRRQWPDSLAGVMTQMWLDKGAQQAQAQARVEILEATLALSERWLETVRMRARNEREDNALALEEAEESRRHLQAEVERLRGQLETTAELQEANDALREELEALKSIDLRH